MQETNESKAVDTQDATPVVQTPKVRQRPGPKPGFKKQVEVKPKTATREDPIEEVNDTLSLQKLIKDALPIWVVNVYRRDDKPIYLSINMGGRTAQVIPPGPEPFEISAVQSYKKLEDCEDLFRAIDKGALQLISDKDARAYFVKNPKAKDRVKAKMKVYSQGTEGGSTQSFKDLIGKNFMQKMMFNPQAAAQAKKQQHVVAPKVEWLVQGLDRDAISAQSFNDQISALDLSELDRAYVMRHPKAREAMGE